LVKKWRPLTGIDRWESDETIVDSEDIRANTDQKIIVIDYNTAS